MIKITKTEIYGWEAAIRGMRNPMNSWENSDTDFSLFGMQSVSGVLVPTIGDNDLSLMKKLVKAGRDHAKFMRMIDVTCDVTAPLYWWKEYDTYKVGTVANSCSTMHKIHDKKFTFDDFSMEHLMQYVETDEGECYPKERMYDLIEALNVCREKFIETNDKKYWHNMIQLLPSSYNQLRTLHLNYEVLRNMYHARKTHKLDEWREFCKWIETLPYAELITGGRYEIK